MKKILALSLVAIMLLGCTACNKPEIPIDSDGTPADSQQENNSSTPKPDKPSGKITYEDVMNHPVSPEEDFYCIDNGKGEMVLTEYEGNDDIVVIPETYKGKPIVKIDQFAFRTSSVKGIKISNTIKEIGAGAFSLTNIQYVICGNQLEYINKCAFMQCYLLKEITFENSLKTIGENAFFECNALKSVELPESIQEIAVAAFYMMPEDFKIIGQAGSVAETYAEEAGILFEAK